MIANKLLLGQQQDTAVVPEGVSFDGSTDYLSRSSDLVGNTDSKTFTFSCWVYNGVGNTSKVYMYDIGTNYFKVMFENGTLNITAKNSSGSLIFNATTTSLAPLNTYINILISVDLANTSNRSIFISDNQANVTWVTHTNDSIDFTQSNHSVARNNTVAYYPLKGRLSHLFLDYTYRDLSIEANRRLFITADGKPADGLESLNPILYLPMTDASTAHVNMGTGGDFTQNGTLATADRGANQDNCVASEFDGVDDYLSKALGLTSSKTITLSFNIVPNLPNTGYIFTFDNGVTWYLTITVQTGGQMEMYAKNSAGTIIFSLAMPNVVKDSSRHMSISFDLADTAKRHLVIDGMLQSPTWGTYTNDLIDLSDTLYLGRLSYSASAWYKGDYGELYFDTNYIDLSTSNPFWDSETNKPIPVRTAMENLGSNPLICMPISADNPTKNYGSGGDFTLNGGGLVGARGMSEYIARGLQSDTLETYSLTSNFYVPDSTTVSVIFAMKPTELGSHKFRSGQFYIQRLNDSIRVLAQNSSGTTIADTGAIAPSASISGKWALCLLCLDMNNQANSKLFINGVDETVWTTFTAGQTIDLEYVSAGLEVAVNNNGLTGDYSTLLMTDDFINFTSEAVRNAYINQLGYPKDIGALIESGEVPTPEVFLDFSDTSNLGKNKGSLADLTTVGATTAGADFNI